MFSNPEINDIIMGYRGLSYVKVVKHAPTESDWKINVDFFNNFINGYNNVDKNNKEYIIYAEKSKNYAIEDVKNCKELCKRDPNFVFNYKFDSNNDIDGVEYNSENCKLRLKAAKEELKITKFNLELTCSACRENMKLYMNAGGFCMGVMLTYHRLAKQIIKIAEKAGLSTN